MSNAKKLERLLAIAKKDKDRETFMQVYELNDALDLLPSSHLASALLPMVFEGLPKTLSGVISVVKWGKTADGISGNAATYEIKIMFYAFNKVQDYMEFKASFTGEADFFDDGYGEDVYEDYYEYILKEFNSRKFLEPIKEAYRKHIAKEFPDLDINFGIYPMGKVDVVEVASGKNFHTLFEMHFKGHLALL